MVLGWWDKILGCAEHWKLLDLLDAPILIFASWQVTGEELGSCDKECDVRHCARNCVRHCTRGQSPENWHLLSSFHLADSDLIANSKISLQKATLKLSFFQPPNFFCFQWGTHRLCGGVDESNKDVLLLSYACKYYCCDACKYYCCDACKYYCCDACKNYCWDACKLICFRLWPQSRKDSQQKWEKSFPTLRHHHHHQYCKRLFSIFWFLHPLIKEKTRQSCGNGGHVIESVLRAPSQTQPASDSDLYWLCIAPHCILPPHCLIQQCWDTKKLVIDGRMFLLCLLCAHSLPTAVATPHPPRLLAA